MNFIIILGLDYFLYTVNMLLSVIMVINSLTILILHV